MTPLNFRCYFTTFYLVAVLSIFLVAADCVGAQTRWVPSQVQSGGDLVAVYFTSDKNGWIAGDNGYLASTNDGGATWNKYPLNTTEDINEIYFRNDDNGYLVAGRAMFITKDAGRTWHQTQLFGTSGTTNGSPEFLSVRFPGKRLGFAVGALVKGDIVLDSLIVRTEDGGETWTRVAVPSKVELYHLDFTDSSHGWVVGDKGLILATSDGGVTWHEQRSGVTRALFNVDFRDSDNGYAVGGGGTILRTENGGNVWEKVNNSYTETLKRVDFADDKNGWIVGYGGAILRSGDKGANWVRQQSNTTDRIYGLFMSKKYGWAVGAGGLILKYEK